MKWVVALVLLVATAVSAQEGARLQESYGPITVDGDTTLVAGRVGLTVELDYTAGSGTVAFSCRAHKDAPFLSIATQEANCTGDCLRLAFPECERIRLTMSSCSSCNVKVYTWGKESGR